MSRLIVNNDRIVTTDRLYTGGLHGEVIFGRGRHQVPFTDPFGKKCYRSEFEEVLYRDSNIVPIGGYQFAFDKLFNIGLDQETTLRVGDLNDEEPQMKIGVPRDKYCSGYFDSENVTDMKAVADGKTYEKNPGVNIPAMNYIFGFMMGDGGSREDNMTAIAPDYKNRGLYRAVPFRMTADKSSVQQGKYFGKYVAGYGVGAGDPMISYYVKKFDNPAPHIVHAEVTDNSNELTVVKDDIFSATTSSAIESYVEMNISVSAEDGREFFEAHNCTSRINEFALVSGWYNAVEDDYECLRIFTHFTRPSITLVDNDSIEVIYRLYAR